MYSHSKNKREWNDDERSLEFINYSSSPNQQAWRDEYDWVITRKSKNVFKDIVSELDNKAIKLQYNEVEYVEYEYENGMSYTYDDSSNVTDDEADYMILQQIMACDQSQTPARSTNDDASLTIAADNSAAEEAIFKNKFMYT